MGLVETWIDSRGRDVRMKQIETTSYLQLVHDALPQYVAASEHLGTAASEESASGEPDSFPK